MDSINRPTYDIRQRPHFLIAVTGSEESEPPVRDVSAFLYDLNLLYEIARLATDPSYRHYTFSFRVWTRNDRPLSAQDQLIVHKLRLESPFDLSLLLPFVPKAVEAIRSVVGIAKELAGWRADTRKKNAETERAEIEVAEVKAKHDEHRLAPPEKRTLTEPQTGALKLVSEDDIALTRLFTAPDDFSYADVAEAVKALKELQAGVPTTIRTHLREREAERYFDQASKRLEKSVIRIREITTEIIVPPPQVDKGNSSKTGGSS